MDGINKYKDADTYVKDVIMLRQTITKYTLTKYADKNNVSYPSSAGKEQLVDLICEAMSLRGVAQEQSIGLPSIALQRRYHIDNEIVRFLSKHEFFHTVGTEPFKDKNGKEHLAALYDVYDYFDLTSSDVVHFLYSLAKEKGEK